MNTKEREITFESSLPDWGVGGVQKKISIPIGSLDFLRNRDSFKLILLEGIGELIKNNSDLQDIIYSSPNYSGSNIPPF